MLYLNDKLLNITSQTGAVIHVRFSVVTKRINKAIGASGAQAPTDAMLYFDALTSADLALQSAMTLDVAADGTIVTAQACPASFGYAAADLEGKTLDAVLPIRGSMQSLIAQWAAEGTSRRFKPKHVAAMLPSGAAVAAVAEVLDKAPGVASATALRLKVWRLEACPCIFEVDGDLRVTSVEGPARQITGYHPHKLCGRSVMELLPRLEIPSADLSGLLTSGAPKSGGIKKALRLGKTHHGVDLVSRGFILKATVQAFEKRDGENRAFVVVEPSGHPVPDPIAAPGAEAPLGAPASAAGGSPDGAASGIPPLSSPKGAKMRETLESIAASTPHAAHEEHPVTIRGIVDTSFRGIVDSSLVPEDQRGTETGAREATGASPEEEGHGAVEPGISFNVKEDGHGKDLKSELAGQGADAEERERDDDAEPAEPHAPVVDSIRLARRKSLVQSRGGSQHEVEIAPGGGFYQEGEGQEDGRGSAHSEGDQGARARESGSEGSQQNLGFGYERMRDWVATGGAPLAVDQFAGADMEEEPLRATNIQRLQGRLQHKQALRVKVDSLALRGGV